MLSDEEYFKTLYGLVSPTRDQAPSSSRYILCSILHQTEFIPWIRMDEDRALDGLTLRHTYNVGSDEPCSMFEMLLALSKRIVYQTEGLVDWEAKDWFWLMLDNLGLFELNDEALTSMSGPLHENQVHQALKRLNDRTYEYNGTGGLFPLAQTEQDQRKVDIWYQMSAYLLERLVP